MIAHLFRTTCAGGQLGAGNDLVDVGEESERAHARQYHEVRCRILWCPIFARRTVLTNQSVSVILPFVATYEVGRLLEVLGDPTRRTIFEQLADRPWAVGELAAELPISRPAVSQHLKVLKDAGLVVEQASGTRRIYRLDPVAVSALRDQLDAFWTRALAGYADTVEEQEQS